MTSFGPNPYRAPQNETEDLPPSAATSLAGFVDQGRLLGALTVLLGIQIAIAAINAIACAALAGMVFSPEREQLIVDVSNVLATANAVLYLVTIVPFGMFLVRANRNAHLIASVPIGFTPASMIWWFLVPLLNLVRPFQAVQAVWQSSDPEDPSTRGGLVMKWWMLWLANSMGSKLIELLTKNASVVVQNLGSTFDNLLGCAVSVVALLMLCELGARQQRGAARVAMQRMRLAAPPLADSSGAVPKVFTSFR